MNNLRKGFPALKRCVYLNTASSGLLHEKVFDFRQEHDLDFLIGGSTFREQHDQILAGTREVVGKIYNCPAANVALASSFSVGFNFLLEGIPKKSKILLLKDDYPSINLAVENRDFRVSYAEADEHLEENIEDVIKTHRPDFFMFSLVQWLNGIKIDFEFLKHLKQTYPELVLLADGTQYCGTETFNFENSGIDILGASAYKWLNAGYGNAFFLVNETAKEYFSPRVRGYGSTVGKYKENQDSFIGKLEPGHLDTLNIGSLKTAIDLQLQTGMSRIEKQIGQLARKAKHEFESRGLLEEKVVKRKEHAPIFNLKGDENLFQRLKEHNIICIPRGNGIRLGFHYFNTEEELDFLLKVLTP